jgi:transcriptional/translational regulatory protein YebC/TACO1
MEAALEAGANDFIANEDGSFEVVTGPFDFLTVKATLEAKKYRAEFAEVLMKPQNQIELAGDEAVKMQKLIDALESLDDVQEVYTSAVFDEA